MTTYDHRTKLGRKFYRFRTSHEPLFLVIFCVVIPTLIVMIIIRFTDIGAPSDPEWILIETPEYPMWCYGTSTDIADYDISSQCVKSSRA